MPSSLTTGARRPQPGWPGCRPSRLVLGISAACSVLGVDVVWTALGVMLIVLALRDIFDVLFHPLGRGMIARRVVRGMAALARRAPRGRGDVGLLAGPPSHIAIVAPRTTPPAGGECRPARGPARLLRDLPPLDAPAGGGVAVGLPAAAAAGLQLRSAARSRR